MPPLIKRNKQEGIAFNLRPDGLVIQIHESLDGRTSTGWAHGPLHQHHGAHARCF